MLTSSCPWSALSLASLWKDARGRPRKANPDFAAALAPAKDYLAACQKVERAARSKSRRTQAVIYTLMLGIIAGLVGFINRTFLQEQIHWRTVMHADVLRAAAEKEKAANPGADFKECANGCPTMIVVPPGKFMMGTAGEAAGDEGPQHEVTIGKSFAVSRTEVTFAEWDQCVSAGACARPSDSGWGRGDRPAVNVSWEDAKLYVEWLSRMTGKPYRLLSEAEWEYAARAGSTGKWSFGDEDAQLDDHAWYDKNSDSKTQTVAKKKPNALGLYDMHGNVWEWVEDPWHGNYESAPTDGTPWLNDGDVNRHVVRGGSWNITPDSLRSANRDWYSTGGRDYVAGFRVGRTLTP